MRNVQKINVVIVLNAVNAKCVLINAAKKKKKISINYVRNAMKVNVHNRSHVPDVLNAFLRSLTTNLANIAKV